MSAGLIKIEAGGRKRPFRFQYAAMKRLCADLEVPGIEQLPQALDPITFEALESMLFHGFKAGAKYAGEDVDFKREDLEDWLDEDLSFFQPAITEVQKQIVASLRGPDNGQPAKKKAPAKSRKAKG